MALSRAVSVCTSIADRSAFGVSNTCRFRSGSRSGIMTIGSSAADTPEETVRKFDSAAGRMFRFIRMGRDVEKIGAPKQPKLKPWLTLLIDSWKK